MILLQVSLASQVVLQMFDLSIDVPLILVGYLYLRLMVSGGSFVALLRESKRDIFQKAVVLPTELQVTCYLYDLSEVSLRFFLMAPPVFCFMK